MEEKKAESTNKNVKKANLLEHNSIKHILDESVSDIVKSCGYKEDVRLSNMKLILGTVIIVVALVAQFYNKNMTDYIYWMIVDKMFGFFDYGKYVVLNGVLQLILYTKEKNAILFTYPPEGSFTSTGLVVSSKLPRFSDEYTLTIDSADPKSISAGKSVHLTKSVTQWFTKDGVLVEGLFWKDVEALIKDYAKEGEPKKKK
uniref:Signal peptidase complex subunit 2 n=1 Tax=Brassica campestris TaxID=3711 RepID=A0A3P5ZAD4_BRACM|nr:unnamed protein product [Brassica rapa]